MSTYFPGKIIGMLGGGQLGRMSALAGSHMGFGFHVFEPSQKSPAGAVSLGEVNAPYENSDALLKFAEGIDVCTLEFENIPVSALEKVQSKVPVHPSPYILGICQSREKEKFFLRENGFVCANFEIVTCQSTLEAAVSQIGYPCVLKSAYFGYDGKGQIKIENAEDLKGAWESLSVSRGVLESFVDLAQECSVIVSRNTEGELSSFECVENIHRNHILHMSIFPGRVEASIAEQAQATARQIAEKLGLVGVLAVEFFITKSGKLLVNELAPRPHNSGHCTIEACATSQFEQHIRAVTGMPLGDTKILQPTVMVNLLGDLWKDGQGPNWQLLLEQPNVKVHLYGKAEARPGRKMGHFCVLSSGEDMSEVVAQAEALFGAIS